MKTKEMLDNYLISLGCSIKKDYTYIPNREYDYLKKEKDKTLEIAGYKVKLNKKIRNSRELIAVTGNAKSSFSNSGNLSGDLNSACETIFKNSLIYITDFLKYSLDKLNVNLEIMQNLITQSENSLNEVDKDIRALLSKMDGKINKAREFNQELNASMNAHAQAKANTIEGGYITFHDNRTWYGGSVTGNVTLKKGMSDSQLADQISYNSSVVNMFQREDEEKILKETLQELNNLKSSIAKKFNEKLEEILCVKLDSIFDYDAIFKYGDDIENDPLINKNWVQAINSFKESDFELAKEAITYYDLNITPELKPVVEQNMYDYYIKNFKCDYDGVDYKFYLFIKGNDFGHGSGLSNKIYNYFYHLAENKKVKKKKEINNIFDEELKQIKNCGYISEDYKNELIEKYEECVKNEKKRLKNNKQDLIIKILLVIVLLLTIAIGILYWGFVQHLIGYIIVIAIIVSAVKFFMQ